VARLTIEKPSNNQCAGKSKAISEAKILAARMQLDGPTTKGERDIEPSNGEETA
jgi:hypothetical protein